MDHIKNFKIDFEEVSNIISDILEDAELEFVITKDRPTSTNVIVWINVKKSNNKKFTDKFINYDPSGIKLEPHWPTKIHKKSNKLRKSELIESVSDPILIRIFKLTNLKVEWYEYCYNYTLIPTSDENPLLKLTFSNSISLSNVQNYREFRD